MGRPAFAWIFLLKISKILRTPQTILELGPREIRGACDVTTREAVITFHHSKATRVELGAWNWKLSPQHPLAGAAEEKTVTRQIHVYQMPGPHGR